jgi:hypothetical protein
VLCPFIGIGRGQFDVDNHATDRDEQRQLIGVDSLLFYRTGRIGRAHQVPPSAIEAATLRQHRKQIAVALPL